MKPNIGRRIWRYLRRLTRPGPLTALVRRPWAILVVFVCLTLSLAAASDSRGSAYNFFRVTAPGTVFAIDPDLTIRRIDPHAPDHIWTFGKSWGIPPLYFQTQVPGLYDRVDFFYPFGYREESTFQSKLAFTPLFKSRWSKLPPFEGHSRCLTLYHGRSDLGQQVLGLFPVLRIHVSPIRSGPEPVRALPVVLRDHR